MLEGYYSVELSEKIRRGQKENALKCNYNGGSIALGYCVDREQYYQIDSETAPIVQEIFTRYADGEPIKEITSSLNAKN